MTFEQRQARAIVRFEKKYTVSETQTYRGTPCWLWAKFLSKAGYGQFFNGFGMQLAHQYSYEQKYGPVPSGLELDHLCRVTACVNPDHLEAVTRQENVLRGNAGIYFAMKTHCPYGHPYEGDNIHFIRTKCGKGWGRSCRICERRRSAAWTEKRRAMK